jgi:hypothetical protein
VGDAGNPRFVAAHVRDLAQRSRADDDKFAGLMLRWAWPAGHDDRFDPIGIDWDRRWAPYSVAAEPLECSCAEGRCTVCN